MVHSHRRNTQQSLNLTCSQISSLQPLVKLTSLQSLDLSGCNRISDLERLAGLTSLQSIALSGCAQISDLQPLAGLTALQSLDLSGCEQISDLQPLARLTLLQALNLSRCRQIGDLQPLVKVTSLQSLDLSGCNQISDLQPLAGLTSLQSLDLSGCKQISDLQPLTGFISLQSLSLSECEQIGDLQPLVKLTSLQSLSLSECELISDLQPLAKLTSLQSLDLSGCKQISDLQPLAELTSLQRLHLNQCEDVASFGPLEPRLPGLLALHLYGSQFSDLPTEICGESDYANVIDKVRAHYRDLRAGASQDAEVRVLVLGNGGAGKTQLCRRLRDIPYNPAIPSTHGIELGEMQLELEDSTTPIRLNLWDFGGQEIYHGSHSLFLQGHAVCLILWTPRLENASPYQENGLTLRHRPLAYWLDYVRAFAGIESPVIVVQSQCDTPGDRVRVPPGGANPSDLASFPVQASAKSGLGLDSVRAALKEGVRDLLAGQPLPPIGTGRVRVRQRLRDLLESGRSLPEPKRWLDRAEFDHLCAEEGGISDIEALLDFLHHGGVVFYRPGLFGGRIVLDQNWALKAIYSIFDRGKCLPLLRNHGRFSRSDLKLLVWQKFDRQEQKVFLGMMQSCRICFSVGGDELIALELLPTWPEAQDSLLAGRLLPTAPDSEAQANFNFLHEGVLRTYLSALGEKVGDAGIYWKYGCWFYEKTTNSRALIQSRWENSETETGPGVLEFRAWGPRARALLEPLVEALEQLATGQRPVIRWSEAAAEPRPEKDIGLSRLQFVETILPASGRPAIYVSYGWGDKSDKVVDGLCRACEAESWQVFRDKTSMRYGDRISTFMKSISRADLILVVINEKYLRSPYCMAELHGIYQRSLGEKDDFLARVVPFTLECVKIGTWRDRVAHAEHWRGEFEAMEASSKSLGTGDLGKYKAVKNWYNDVGDILEAIGDVLHPDGFDAIMADDYQGLRRMLEKWTKANARA